MKNKCKSYYIEYKKKNGRFMGDSNGIQCENTEENHECECRPVEQTDEHGVKYTSCDYDESEAETDKNCVLTIIHGSPTGEEPKISDDPLSRKICKVFPEEKKEICCLYPYECGENMECVLVTETKEIEGEEDTQKITYKCECRPKESKK